MKRLPEVDVLMTAEAKGICLTYELSRLMGMKDSSWHARAASLTCRTPFPIPSAP